MIFKITLTISLTVSLLIGCSSNKMIRNADAVSTQTKINHADTLFAKRLRTNENVSRALKFLSNALHEIPGRDSTRYSLLVKAAHYANWLAYNSEIKNEKTTFSSQALKHCEEAIRLDSQRVEAFYFRGIATGLFAESNKVQGRDAMRRIQNDGLHAIALDETFDFGGPHRLLGLLYLRAPGPPTGLGSIKKALHHLHKAYEIAPLYPDNNVFLAEAFFKNNELEKSRNLLNNVIKSAWHDETFENEHSWRSRAQELLLKIDSLQN